MHCKNSNHVFLSSDSDSKWHKLTKPLFNSRYLTFTWLEYIRNFVSYLSFSVTTPPMFSLLISYKLKDQDNLLIKAFRWLQGLVIFKWLGLSFFQCICFSINSNGRKNTYTFCQPRTWAGYAKSSHNYKIIKLQWPSWTGKKFTWSDDERRLRAI